MNEGENIITGTRPVKVRLDPCLFLDQANTANCTEVQDLDYHVLPE